MAKVQAAPRLSGWRIWRLRLAALVVTPAACLGLLEIALRVSGFGYPTAFLLKSSNHGRPTFVQNNRFGWRFFGKQKARLPAPFSISREHSQGCIRIFVFGESAAYGDPQPRFGLPRLLEAILGLRHPDEKFEIVNAAMTGINSHVILPIARDCTAAGADVWVLYMGNNEVIGPFGPGTVFGAQGAPRFLVHAGLALKSTRTGELLELARQKLERNPQAGQEWQGMGMFLDKKMGASDPRLAAVYRNFQENLEDIIRAGHSGGAVVVLSTVAVNLRDCAPFASLHRLDLAEAQLAAWQNRFGPGVEAQEKGNWPQAKELFNAAASIDDRFAELHFRLGQCAAALGEADLARAHFVAARDLDALRFRCDAQLNELIRAASANGSAAGIRLADAERLLAQASPLGVPGSELFYEHVHLNFQGNYLVARIIAEQVEQSLAQLRAGPEKPWPSLADCARRLARTGRDDQLAYSEILGRMRDAPFTLQSNHATQRDYLVGLARKLPAADSVESLRLSRSACEAALAQCPADALLEHQLAEVAEAQEDWPKAETASRRALELLPSDGENWMLLGLALARQEKYTDAVAAFERVSDLDPQAVWGRHNLALCLQKLGRRDEAVRQFKQALAIKPQFGVAWLGLGELYEETGRSNLAGLCYECALTNRVNQPDDLILLARFCLHRGWFEAAATNFAEAIELRPADAGLRLETGRAMSLLGRHEEAARRYAEAVQLEPDEAQAHLQLGVELGRLGRAAEAEGEFRQALQFKPAWSEANLNLGIALYHEHKLLEAREQFELVLRSDPNNRAALHFIQALKEPETAVPK